MERRGTVTACCSISWPSQKGSVGALRFRIAPLTELSQQLSDVVCMKPTCRWPETRGSFAFSHFSIRDAVQIVKQIQPQSAPGRAVRDKSAVPVSSHVCLLSLTTRLRHSPSPWTTSRWKAPQITSRYLRRRHNDDDGMKGSGAAPSLLQQELPEENFPLPSRVFLTGVPAPGCISLRISDTSAARTVP